MMPHRMIWRILAMMARDDDRENKRSAIFWSDMSQKIVWAGTGWWEIHKGRWP
jgi:hypothetical protein